MNGVRTKQCETRKNWKLRRGMLLLGSLVLTSFSLVSNVAAFATVTFPSSSEVVAAIQKSSLVFRAPVTSVPPLSPVVSDFQSINPATGLVDPSSRLGCSINDNSTSIAQNFATKCVYGDLTSKKSILLIGDSNAWMWIPALDTFGFLNHVKVVALTHNGCSPWARPWMPQKAVFFAENFNEAMCTTWRNNALTSGLSLNPNLVIPVGIDLPSPYTAPTQGFITSLTSLVARVGKSRTLFLDPPPHFANFSTMAGCVSTRSTALNLCEVQTRYLLANQVSIVQRLISTQQKIPIVETSSLFCGKAYCPIFVSLQNQSWLIYGDGYHINLRYSQLLGASLNLQNYLK
jgi:hypothetical protein